MGRSRPADQIMVKPAGGQELGGRVVGRDPKTDLALIKVEGGSAGPSDQYPFALSTSCRKGSPAIYRLRFSQKISVARDS